MLNSQKAFTHASDIEKPTKQSACDIQFSYKQNVEEQAGT